MKLRLRFYESKETLKIEAPNSCTLAQLKIILSQTLPNSPSSDSIRLSLNRKDELQSDGQESLNSIGIASGDLIFYFLALPVNSAPKSDYMDTQDENPNPNSLILQTDMESENENSDSIEKFAQDENPNPNSPILQTDMEAENENSDSIGKFTQDENPNSDSLILQTDMEAENENSSDAIAKSFSVPGFLRKVFAEELRNDNGGDHKLIVTAVHAVLLESGFVGFDRDSNAVITNGLHLSWPNSRRFTLSLFYTLPEIVSGASGGETTHTVVLKFQSLAKTINVYGSLGGGGGRMGKSGTRSVRLNEDQLMPLLNVVWAGLCDIADIVIDKDGSLSKEKEVFKFWRTVKDNLALPLLIDICEKSGLALPPCFMRLPTDLKSKILESLPGVEVAKVSCLCSELQYLASDDDLWKLKFAEEFGNWTDEVQGSWKKAFIRAWERRNSKKRPLPALYWPATRWRRYGL